MRTFKYSLLGLFSATLFFACGDDVTKVTKMNQETSGLEVVASADSLGKCTAELSGEMKFVSKENAVYVCSDSSWKNVSAVENVPCSAELLSDSSGYKIVCGGDSVGVILNGKDGKKGEAGKAGTSCTVTESPLLGSDVGGGYQVVCGKDTVGTLANGRDGEGCTLTDNGDGSVSQVCGSDTVNLYKAFCGGKFFNPDSSFCYEDSVVSLCGGKSYDLSESFCSGDSIYALCGGNRFDTEAQFCFNDSIVPFCNGKSYSLDSSFCYRDSVVALCGGKIYDLQDSVCHEERLFGFFEDSRDGQVYRTVQIGAQTWMAENLNYAYMPDTSSFCYNNSADSCAKYGRLYTWAAAMDSAAVFSEDGKGCGNGVECIPTEPVRGVCPIGWHLPDSTEWMALKNFVAGQIGASYSVGYALKSTSGWADNGNGSDSFGFGALPAGYRTNYASFHDVLNEADFWNSAEIHAGSARFSYMDCIGAGLYISFKSKDYALSIRCLKDN